MVAPFLNRRLDLPQHPSWGAGVLRSPRLSLEAAAGDELLYQERDWSAPDRCGQEVRWFVLSAAGTSAVTDLRGLLARWYGDRLVELICEDRRPGPGAALLDSWAEERQSCYSAGPPAGELRLGGKKVDVVEEVFVVGFRGF